MGEDVVEEGVGGEGAGELGEVGGGLADVHGGEVGGEAGLEAVDGAGQAVGGGAQGFGMAGVGHDQFGVGIVLGGGYRCQCRFELGQAFSGLGTYSDYFVYVADIGLISFPSFIIVNPCLVANSDYSFNFIEESVRFSKGLLRRICV